MKKEEFEVYADAVNANIIRVPGRNYPAMVVQGDTMSAFYSSALSILKSLRNKENLEAEQEAMALCDELRQRLAHYADVLESAGFNLPYGIDHRNPNAVPEHRWPVPDFEDSVEESFGGDDNPVAKLVNMIIFKAVNSNASAVHIDFDKNGGSVIYRNDGSLAPVMKMPVHLRDPLISKIKKMAGMDRAERRLPQLGIITVSSANRDCASQAAHIEVHTLPGLDGEKVVLKILADEAYEEIKLEDLGMEADQLGAYRSALNKERGMIILCGKTQSGMNTTVYSSLLEIDRVGKSVASIEVAPRAPLPGVHQIVENAEIGFDTASALRELLRSDTNVAYVREIMSLEVLELCIKAVLEKDMLVFTTVHANTPASALVQFVSMGADPWLVAESVSLIQGQRKLRRLCTKCRIECREKDDVLAAAGIKIKATGIVRLYRHAGCQECIGGYSGTVLVCETMPVSNDIKELLLKGCQAGEMRRNAVVSGMTTLRGAALNRVAEGLTSVDEVLLNTPPDEDV